VNYVLDADIRGFFDNLDKSWLIKFVEHRVADPRILRLIQKWLNAGVIKTRRVKKQKTDRKDAPLLLKLIAGRSAKNATRASVRGLLDEDAAPINSFQQLRPR
jgi:retron-type reverse transcriptase